MRKKAAASPRVPHEDPRIEAQIRQVEARYAAIRRTEERLADITKEQRQVDAKARGNAGYVGHEEANALASALRRERADLEAFISQAHKDVTEILNALGDSALYLGAMS